MKKKLLTLVLTATMIVSLVACGEKQQEYVVTPGVTDGSTSSNETEQVVESTADEAGAEVNKETPDEIVNDVLEAFNTMESYKYHVDIVESFNMTSDDLEISEEQANELFGATEASLELTISSDIVYDSVTKVGKNDTNVKMAFLTGDADDTELVNENTNTMYFVDNGETCATYTDLGDGNFQQNTTEANLYDINLFRYNIKDTVVEKETDTEKVVSGKIPYSDLITLIDNNYGDTGISPESELPITYTIDKKLNKISAIQIDLDGVPTLDESIKNLKIVLTITIDNNSVINVEMPEELKVFIESASEASENETSEVATEAAGAESQATEAESQTEEVVVDSSELFK